MANRSIYYMHLVFLSKDIIMDQFIRQKLSTMCLIRDVNVNHEFI